MKYAHIIAEVLSQPWAILDAKFDSIVSVLARREAGEEFTEEQIRAAVGERKGKLPEMYCVTEDGARFPFGALLAAQADPSRVTAGSGSAGKGKLIAVLPVYGVILPRAADFDMSEFGTSIEALRKNFRAAMNNPDVKAIVLNFDSPGGSVYHVDEFAAEIFDARGQKKIVAQIDPLCASAAYYLAGQADEIVITPSGEAGSIGVRMMHQDLSKALEMKGIKVTNITYGKYKVENNPFEPMSDEGMAFAQQRVNDYGDMFVKALARGREMKVSQVKEDFGEGRVFGAAEAKKRGMVDRVATLDETLSRLGASAESARVPMGAGAETNVATPTATAENNTEVQVKEETTVQTSAAAADEARGAERSRVSQIMQLASEHGATAKADKWIADGVTVEKVKDEILASFNPTPIAQPSAEGRRVEFGTDQADKLPADLLFGRVCRAYAGAKGDRKTAALIARRSFNDAKVASMFEAAVDPQRASDFASGGFLLGDNLSSAVIELLRPRSVVRSLNPTMAPLVDGVLTLPKLTGGATASYLGETKLIPATKVTGGQVKASAKTLGAIVVITNKLLRSPSANADGLVRDDAIRAVAQKEDATFIRSLGTEYTPKGLLYYKGAASFSANATVNLVNVTADLQKGITALEEANVGMTRVGWILAPRSKGYLMQVRDGNGNYAFKDEMVKGTLMGFPFRSTSQIPKNLGGGSSSEVYLADFADVVVADAPQIAIEMTSEASIDDGAGNLTPLFQSDMSAIKILMEHDLVVRHSESVIVIDAVNWA
jgi:signal peptide peptidase SppA